MTIVTDAQIDAIIALKLERKSYEQIARRVKLKAETVRYHCEARGLTKVSARNAAMMRGGRPVRPFTPAEDARIVALFLGQVLSGAKPNLTSIARELGRSQPSVRRELIKLQRQAALFTEAA